MGLFELVDGLLQDRNFGFICLLVGIALLVITAIIEYGTVLEISLTNGIALIVVGLILIGMGYYILKLK
jgi:hypothetical protein